LIRAKPAVGRNYLAADFKSPARGILWKAQRKAPDRSGVAGDVIPRLAIAPCGRSDQFAVLVNDRNGDSVDFGLDQHRNILDSEQLAKPIVELDQLRFGIGVVETHHPDGMVDLLKSRNRLASDSLRRRIR